MRLGIIGLGRAGSWHLENWQQIEGTTVVAACDPSPASRRIGDLSGARGTAGLSTAGVALTPRLPISIEPNGIPVRAIPPGAVGVVEVGVDDEITLLEPEPHIPDMPDVSTPEVVDTPSGIDICEDVDVPGIAMGSVVAAVASVPVLPVAGAAVPGAIPPPS